MAKQEGGPQGGGKGRTSSWVTCVVVLGIVVYAAQQAVVWEAIPREFLGQAELAFKVIGGLCAFRIFVSMMRFWVLFKKNLDAERPKESTHSSRVATVQDIEEAGLVDRPGWFQSLFRRADNTVRFYAGIVGRTLLELPAVHMLIVAPSGAGKNRGLVFILLGLIKEPCVVTDVKKENYEVTAGYRAKKFNQRIILLTVGGEHSYNPLDILLDGLAAGGGDVLTDARSLALALVPEPEDQKNAYWRQGGRDVIVLTMIGLCVLRPETANLATVQTMVTDMDLFVELCHSLIGDSALEGDLSVMAQGMVGQSENTPKSLQEYINVAKQAMVPYARSGILHALTETSTFRYRDLKYKDAQGRHLTIYNHFDSSRRVVFEPFGALLNSCMLLELQRDPCPQRVVFVNDEAANFVVKDLPKQMTIVRGDGNVHMINVCQSRAQMRATWGAEGEQMVLDNSDLKIFFGVSTEEEARKVSELTGQQNVLSPSYALGHQASDGVGESRAIAQRAVLTPDMVRREKRAIVIYRQERVMLVSLPGYERCEPMRSQFGINTRYGSKRLEGPLEVEF